MSSWSGGHGVWLSERLDDEYRRSVPSSKLNSLILTTDAAPSFAAFPPGTVYKATNNDHLKEILGYSLTDIQRDCFDAKKPDESPHFQAFCARTTPVFIEISPACDFHQGNRRLATLMAGLVCPLELKNKAKSKDAFKITPAFEDKLTTPATEVVLVLCSNYRLTINHNSHPEWLVPWIRLRDILVTEIRNWHSSQAARVGYLSF